eukprot:15457658-Alexandrium_andersonii.AAC.1
MDLYRARCPKCHLQSAQGPSVLQSAPIRHPPCGKITSGIRSLNCAAPGMASKLVPEAPDGRLLY